MQKTRKNIGRGPLITFATTLVLLLSACGGAKAKPTPTLSVDAIFTAAHQTFEAQVATQLALTPPTETPSPTSLPTLAPPSPLPTVSFATLAPTLGGSSACDNSAYVADVTVPDDTVMSPGQNFDKTWKLQNTGTCTWSTGYKLVFADGELMSGTESAITASVAPGNQVDITVKLTAPKSAGTFKGNWRMQNASGQPFGDVIYVQIKVGSGTAAPTSESGSVTIAGDASLPDVVITYTGTGGSASGSTTADNDGNYSFSVDSGWSGTVKPSKGIWVFSPASRTYTNITSDQGSQDFQAAQPTATSG